MDVDSDVKPSTRNEPSSLFYSDGRMLLLRTEIIRPSSPRTSSPEVVIAHVYWLNKQDKCFRRQMRGIPWQPRKPLGTDAVDTGSSRRRMNEHCTKNMTR